jgi:hypothetical protein
MATPLGCSSPAPIWAAGIMTTPRLAARRGGGGEVEAEAPQLAAVRLQALNQAAVADGVGPPSEGRSRPAVRLQGTIRYRFPATSTTRRPSAHAAAAGVPA